MGRETLRACLEDQRFVDYILATKGEQQKTSLMEAFETRQRALVSERMITAVLGIQGAGKSSLLNALIVGDDVLPVEADETTCIPVELSRATGSQHGAEVVFKNGEKQSIPLERDSLDQYVNNEYNPGNEHGVDHIKVNIDSDMLSEEAVFVDLPGVASLTEANQETTLRYINDCTGAIYLLRTVPPITRLEALFLKATWPQLNQVIFIQNFWHGESERELAEGKEHNEKVLRQIAEELNLSQDVEVITVQVRDAVQAAFAGDSELAKCSGLETLRRRVSDLRTHWRNDITHETASWLFGEGTSAQRRYLKQRDDLNKDLDVAIQEIEAEMDGFRAKESELKERFWKLKNVAMQLQVEIVTQMNIHILEQESETREQVESGINRGISTGDYLNRLVSNAAENAQVQIMEQLQYRMEQAVSQVVVTFEDIWQEAVGKTDVSIEDMNEGVKWEKAMPFGLGVGGPVAATLLLSNPLGWGVAIAGVVGSLIGSWIKGKKEAKRAREARRAARQALDGAFSEIRTTVQKQTELSFNNILKKLDTELDTALRQERDALEERRGILERSRGNREAELLRVNEAIAYINEWLQSLQAVTAIQKGA